MGSGEIDKPCFLLSRRVYTHGRQGCICVSVRALQRNRTNSTYVYWGSFMIEINLHGYGGPEVPHLPPAARDAESLWCSSVWVWRPQNQDHQCPRAGEDGCLSSARVNLSFLCLFALHRLSWTGWGLPAFARAIFTQSTNTNANLFQNHPPRHAQK